MKRGLAFVCALVMLFSLAACGGKTQDTSGGSDGSGGSGEAALDLRTLSLEEITEKAKEEGRVESVGMPDSWAHWDYSWASILEKYGITHADVDMSSGEEVALFAAEKDDPTKDVGDVGHAFTITAKEEDVLQPYKASCCDSIPDWAKDPEGYWTLTYTGTTAFIINDAATGGVVPKSWKELMDSDIVVNMGNVIGGASSQANILA